MLAVLEMGPKIVRLSPPNSVLFIADPDNRDVLVPTEFSSPSGVDSTETCVAVGTLMEFDGETEVTIGPRAAVAPDRAAVFDGRVLTPTGIIALETAPRDELYRMKVGATTRICVWTNRNQEPDEIIIGLE